MAVPAAFQSLRFTRFLIAYPFQKGQWGKMKWIRHDRKYETSSDDREADSSRIVPFSPTPLGGLVPTATGCAGTGGVMPSSTTQVLQPGLNQHMAEVRLGCLSSSFPPKYDVLKPITGLTARHRWFESLRAPLHRHPKWLQIHPGSLHKWTLFTQLDFNCTINKAIVSHLPITELKCY